MRSRPRQPRAALPRRDRDALETIVLRSPERVTAQRLHPGRRRRGASPPSLRTLIGGLVGVRAARCVMAVLALALRASLRVHLLDVGGATGVRRICRPMATLGGSARLPQLRMQHGAQLGRHEFGIIAIWGQRSGRAGQGAAAEAAAGIAIHVGHILLLCEGQQAYVAPEREARRRTLLAEARRARDAARRASVIIPCSHSPGGRADRRQADRRSR